MPRRNLYLLLLVSIVSFICFQRLPTNHYSRTLAAVADHVSHDYFRPVEDIDVFEGGMKGMMQRLDENSAYISAAKKRDFTEDISKEFGGIGVHVVQDPETKRIEVVLPIPLGSAVAAGIRAGDVIVSVDGKSIAGMSLRETSSLLRGKPDTPVTVSVLHAGASKPVEVKMQRKIIHEDTVQGFVLNRDGTWDFQLPGQPKIGYIRVTAFAEAEGGESPRNTLSDLKQALKEIDAEHLHGLVLDLRNNPGGSLAIAVGICNLFVASGDIVTTRGRDGNILKRFQADGTAPYAAGPKIVVLVNQFSASASEIFSACLQDHDRATIVGQRSYGKGTVQEVVDLGGDLGTLKMTIASFWRPSGKNIHRIHRRPVASTSDDGADDEEPTEADKGGDWGVRPNPDCEVVVDKDEELLVARWDSERTLARLTNKGQSPDEKVTVVDRVLERALEVLDGEGK